MRGRFNRAFQRRLAEALAISDCDELTGLDIAQDLLDGETKFTPRELEVLAGFKGVTIEYLTEYDPAFKRYADPVTEARKVIAARLIGAGARVEFAAEICDLPVDKVKRLK